MPPRHLINENGQPFSTTELDEVGRELDSIEPHQRTEFRNSNAAAIASLTATKVLIVAGPGTGKSTLFKQRILYWLDRNRDSRILALSFVRKLVADLRADIDGDNRLTEDQKAHVDVHTLHKYARRIVEQNHGTREWEFRPHFQIIGQQWVDVVWGDVLLLAERRSSNDFSWRHFENQLHNDQFDDSAAWMDVKSKYFTLCRFYNAAAFADLILRARWAIAENRGLSEHQCFIVDEFQDFNAAEEHLLQAITHAATGTLIVGDDDQVLYESLKAGRPSLIRAIYADSSVANAMLPFCGRCDFHITKTAGHFIKQSGDAASIEKIYLPMAEPGATKKIQAVACAAPSAAIDYIRTFIEENASEIERRRNQLSDGTSKDAFLLILSPQKTANFYGAKPKAELFDLIRPYQTERKLFADDYHLVLNYYALARYPNDNFTFRKVLHHEGVSSVEVLPLLQECLANGKGFAQLNSGATIAALSNADAVRVIIDTDQSVAEKVEALCKCIRIADPEQLCTDIERATIDSERVAAIQHQDEEQAELEEIAIKQMAAVELLSIAGSKGLSADHVIIIGFDDVNLSRTTRNAFYVALTRARRSVHLVTALKAGGATKAHSYLADLPDQHMEFLKYTKSKKVKTPFANRRAFVSYLEYIEGMKASFKKRRP